MTFVHDTVLRSELVDGLCLKAGDIAVDCTVGGGGHTEALLVAVGKTGHVIGFDRDESALAATRIRLKQAIDDGQLTLVKTAYSDIETALKTLGHFGDVAGVCADIGVSSPQLDLADRGFSFAKHGPLDMRMDPTSGGTTAADIVNEYEAEDLMRIFREFGEEPQASRIARAIVARRAGAPLTTTTELASLVEDTVSYRTASRKHPATRVFQALRIAVNDELGELSTLLESGFRALRIGGHLAVISFHSLEDRIVKQEFVRLTGRHNAAAIPRDLPFTQSEIEAKINRCAEIIKPFPMLPSEDETRRNPRARSAKLRILTRLQ